MNNYKWSIKARLSKEEQEGMARMLKAVRLKRQQATGVNESFTLLAQHEVRDEEGHRTPQEELDLNG